MVIGKESALVIAFLFSMTAWLVPAFASHTFGSELVANFDFANERPNNAFNFTSVSPFENFTDSQPFSNIDHFQDTAFGKSFEITDSITDRNIVIKIPIQNTSSIKTLNYTTEDVSAGSESNILFAFSNNSFPESTGSSVNIGQGGCDSQPTLCSYEVLGGGFTRFSVNISETEFGLSFPENTYDTIFIGFPNVNQLIDDIDLIEDGAITFTEDFERNLPSAWNVCDNNLYCEPDESTTTSRTINSDLNFTQNSGDLSDILSNNITIESGKTYRLVFRWNATTLNGELSEIGTGNADLCFSNYVSVEQVCLRFNNTFSNATITGSTSLEILTDTSSSGQFNTATVDFVGVSATTYKVDFVNSQTDEWYLADSVSIREVIEDAPTPTGAFAGITSSIIQIIGLILISGVAVLSVIAFARKGTARIDEVIRLVLILIVAIAFVGAVVSLA